MRLLTGLPLVADFVWHKRRIVDLAVFGYIPHMSNAMAFDTLKFVKHLTAHGFSKEQAEVLAEDRPRC